MRRPAWLAVLALAGALVAGCTPTNAGDPSPSDSAATESVTAYVLGPSPDGAHDVVLCEDGAGESVPPTCEGTPVRGWDWDKVPHESVGSDPVTRYGYYTVDFVRLDDGSIEVDMDAVQESDE